MENRKVWFITGASQGLGLALEKKLWKAGYQVTATSRNAQALAKAVEFPADTFVPLQVRSFQ